MGIPIGIIAGMTPSDAIAALLTEGMTEAAIGQAVGVSQSAINKIKRGDMIPNWETGKALIDLAEAKAIPDPSRRTVAANQGVAASETDGTPVQPLKAA